MVTIEEEKMASQENRRGIHWASRKLKFPLPFNYPWILYRELSDERGKRKIAQLLAVRKMLSVDGRW